MPYRMVLFEACAFNVIIVTRNGDGVIAMGQPCSDFSLGSGWSRVSSTAKDTKLCTGDQMVKYQ